MTFTVGSLFTGIGGIDLAFQQAGFEIVYQVENNDYCQQVLQKHWPTVTRYGDIFGIDTLPTVDVMAGGFPCQPVSNAGQQRGTADERWLWPEFLRLIRQSRPAVVFLENVPGLRTNDSGNTFRSILWQLAESGYDAQWAHLRASDAGAPHKRERVFIVAYAANGRFDRWRWLQTDDAAGGGQNREGERIVTNGGNETFAYSQHLRQYAASVSRCNEETVHGSTKRALCTSQPTRSYPSRIISRQTLGNTNSKCNQRNGVIPEQIMATRHGQGQFKSTGYRISRDGRYLESRLGRDSARLPDRLDEHRFPAPPGPQYDWEPPRTTQVKTNRAARLQALGNAVVPQVVYPIALAIQEWMEAHNER